MYKIKQYTKNAFLLVMLLQMLGCNLTEHRDSRVDATIQIDYTFASNERWDGPVKIFTDGKQLPTRFSITAKDLHGTNNGEQVSIDFVLIPSGEVLASGIVLQIEEPIYIATTELSVRQAAILTGATGADGLESFVRELKYDLAGLDRRYTEQSFDDFGSALKALGDDEIGSALAWYFSDPDLPLIGCDYTAAMRLLLRASDQTGASFRLPSLSEWHYAMRAGQNHKFWWGDSPDNRKAVFSSGEEPERDFQLLRRVGDGFPNQWGIRNIVGNASELVMPTHAEWQQIKGLKTNTSHSIRGIGPQIAIGIGGDVLNSEIAGHQSASSLSKQMNLRATTVNGNLSSWFSCVGIRPVIELPFSID